ncbi:DUF5345 family protein [Ethanoligenens sp.]|uniref:DUF5345 family protein n=1 Tax=Ethanoligenens sp. TaxID=2099655 RepID=UPI0039EC074E
MPSDLENRLRKSLHKLDNTLPQTPSLLPLVRASQVKRAKRQRLELMAFVLLSVFVTAGALFLLLHNTAAFGILQMVFLVAVLCVGWKNRKREKAGRI